MTAKRKTESKAVQDARRELGDIARELRPYVARIKAITARLRKAAKTGEVIGTWPDGRRQTVEAWAAGSIAGLVSRDSEGDLADAVTNIAREARRTWREDVVGMIERDNRTAAVCAERRAKVLSLADEIERRQATGLGPGGLLLEFRALTDHPRGKHPDGELGAWPDRERVERLGLTVERFLRIRGEQALPDEG